MQYAQSWSLYPGLDKDDLAYTTPTVDHSNRVRVKEVYWLGSARRADLIVLNRGPIPAPAWTYDGSVTGNWSFVHCLPYLIPLASFVPRSKSPDDLKTLSIMNAAMSVTISKFLPEVLRTLRVLRSDAGIKLKTIIWHGSLYRFRRGQREDSTDGFATGARAEEYFSAILEKWSKNHTTGGGNEEDFWNLYYDTQGTLFFSVLGPPNNWWIQCTCKNVSCKRCCHTGTSSTSHLMMVHINCNGGFKARTTLPALTSVWIYGSGLHQCSKLLHL
jgi:hypothetical protein